MTKIVRLREARKGQFVVVFQCDDCGNEVAERKSHFERKRRHFCSQRCYSAFRRDKLPPEEHHRFGTGHTLDEQAKRRKARSDLNHAIRDGRLHRAVFCEVERCLETPEAHHDNYDKPLEVRWLCFKHHRKHHKAIYENPELLERSS